MCLKLNNNVKVNFDENGVAKCYKIVKRFQALFGAGGRDYYHSLFRREFTYQLGVNEADLPLLPNFDIKSHGIHVFLNPIDACFALDVLHNLWFESLIVIEVVCKKEDLLATGTWEDRDEFKNMQQATFTKVTVESFNDIKLTMGE